jgi:hypothetical protein
MALWSFGYSNVDMPQLFLAVSKYASEISVKCHSDLLGRKRGDKIPE